MARNDWVTFEEFGLDVSNGEHNLGGDTFSVRLLNNDATVPVAGTATPRWADFSANECTQGGGYTTGGEVLTGTSTAEAAGVTTFDATENPTWAATAGSPEDIYWAVLVNDSAAAAQCVGFLDMGGPVSMVDGNVSITWHASGILTVTVSA